MTSPLPAAARLAWWGTAWLGGHVVTDLMLDEVVGDDVTHAVAGLAGVMYGPINAPNYHMGMDFLVLSFVVVVVGGMGSLPGAVAAGFLLGILESFASMKEVITIVPGINQIIIYLVAIVILLTRPRGLMGRRGVMEE